MLPIVVVDGHRIVAEAIAGALRDDGFGKVETADPDVLSVDEIVDRVAAASPTLVLMNLRIAGGHTTLALIRALVAHEAIVLVLSPLDDDALLGECLMRGADAVLGRTTGLDEALDAIRRVVRGETAMSENDRAAMRQAAVRARHQVKKNSSLRGALTAREFEVLEHLVMGRRVRDIAALHDTTESTVRTQVKRILSKLDVGSQTAAVALALRAGWFGPD